MDKRIGSKKRSFGRGHSLRMTEREGPITSNPLSF